MTEAHLGNIRAAAQRCPPHSLRGGSPAPTMLSGREDGYNSIVLVSSMVTDTMLDVEFAAARRCLDTMSGGDPDVLREIFGLLANSLRRSSTMLVDAVDAGGRRQIEQAAHKLRGTSLTTGLTSIACLAEHIELGEAQGDALRSGATRLRDLVEHALAFVRAGSGGESPL